MTKLTRIFVVSLLIVAIPVGIWAIGDILFQGADNTTNTLQGDIVYDRPSVWDGTNWDRWKGYAGAGGVVLQDGDSSTLTDVVDTGADDLANTLNGPVCYSELYGFDGTAWDRVAYIAAADNLSATLAGLQALAVNLFFNGTNLQRWTGLAAGADNTSNSSPAPWVGTFLYGYDGSTWDRVTVTAAADNLSATIQGVTATSIIHGYDGTNNRRIKTDTSGQLIVNQSTSVPGYGRVQDGDSTVLLDVVDDGADNLANTLNGQMCVSEMYGFDGTAWDRVYSSAMAASGDDIDGNVGLNVAAGMYARVDDDTVGPLYKIATINSLKVDTSSVAGTATDVNSGNKSAGSQRIVIATDDVNMSAIKTAVELLDDAIKVDDAGFTPATSSVSMLGCEYDDTLPDSVDEGDAGNVRMSANRNMYMTLRDAGGNERGANVTASNNLTVDVNAQTLTALKVSDDAAANTIANPMYVQISQDGTNAVDATHPIPISDDLAANATANRIWTTCNMDQVSGTTVSVNSGAKDAGTQRVILASDDAAVTSMSVLDDWDTTLAASLNIHGHDAAVCASQIFGRSAAGSVSEVNATSSTGSTDEYDGNTGLQVVSVLAARIDDDNVEHVYQTSGHALKTDVTSIAGTATDTNSGNKSAGSQRVVIATDDVNMSAIATSMSVLDDWDSSDTAKVTISAQTLTAVSVSDDANANATANRMWNNCNVDQINGTATSVSSGAKDNGTQRVILASDDPAVTDLAALEVLQTSMEGDTTAIQTAVEIMDDWDSSDTAKVTIAAQTLTAVKVSDDASANSATNPIYVDSVPQTWDDDNTTNCDDIEDSSIQWTSAGTTSYVEICCTGSSAWVLCGANPTATTSVGGFSYVCAEGSCSSRRKLGSAKCAFIGTAHAGQICFNEYTSP